MDWVKLNVGGSFVVRDVKLLPSVRSQVRVQEVNSHVGSQLGPGPGEGLKVFEITSFLLQLVDSRNGLRSISTCSHCSASDIMQVLDILDAMVSELISLQNNMTDCISSCPHRQEGGNKVNLNHLPEVTSFISQDLNNIEELCVDCDPACFAVVLDYLRFEDL